MKLLLMQNAIGSFYLGDSSKQLSVSMAITHENNLVKVDKYSAVVKFLASGELEYLENLRDDIDSWFESGNIDYIMDEAYEQNKRVISTEPRFNNMVAFYKVFLQNFDELKRDFESSQREKIQQKIDRLTQKLAKVKLPNSSYELFEILNKKAKVLQKSVEYNSNALKDLKEDSEPYIKLQKDIELYNAQIEEIKALESLIPE